MCNVCGVCGCGHMGEQVGVGSVTRKMQHFLDSNNILFSIIAVSYTYYAAVCIHNVPADQMCSGAV